MSVQSSPVIIIGAGMAGAALAWQLAQRGVAATLIERESQPGYHSSGRSAAMFMESYGSPAGRALTRASRAFYEHPPPGFAAQPLLHPRPTLYLARPGQRPALQQLQADMAANGCPSVALPADALPGLMPVLRPGFFAHGLLDAQSADIDAHALLQGFLRGARQAGAQLLTGVQPVAAERSAQQWQLQLDNGQCLRAPLLVNAAGAWVDEVAALCGAAPIGISPRRRSAFTFAAPAGMAIGGWPMACDMDESWYCKPDAGQLLASPANADPCPPHDVQPEELDIAQGIYALEQATTLHIRRPSATWAGLRSFSPDGELAIGFDAQRPGFFWLAGQGGWGIQSAAAASQLAASVLLGQPLPGHVQAQGIDPARLSPARFHTVRT